MPATLERPPLCKWLRRIFGFTPRRARISAAPDPRLFERARPRPVSLAPDPRLFEHARPRPVSLALPVRVAEVEHSVRPVQIKPAAQLAPAAIKGNRFGRGAPPQLQALYARLIDPQLAARTYESVRLPHPLYPFQRAGVAFLLKQRSALLADDMGLGKTVQAITAARVLFERGELARMLVVAPKSVLTNWRRHFAVWSPNLDAAVLSGPPYARGELWDSIVGGVLPVGIVTYDTLARDCRDPRIRMCEFDLIVADEIQRIKNPRAKRTQAMRSLRAKRRWGLSGTPLENNVAEYAAVLRFLDPTLKDHPDRDRGRRSRRSAEQRSRDRGQWKSSVRRSAREMQLRRKKEDVLHDLPSLVSNLEYIDLTEQQRQAYEQAERRGISTLRGQSRRIVSVLQLIHELKQICNGVDGSSAKREWLQDYIAIAASRRDKVLVYSQYTKVLPPAVKQMFKYQYSGELSDAQRERVLDQFRSDPREHALLMSVRAGGLGINLQAANRVVHFDSWWNPAIQAQATARAHRLGQEKTVFEVTLVCKDTIEERIQKLLEEKRQLFEDVIENQNGKDFSSGLTEEELYSLFDL